MKKLFHSLMFSILLCSCSGTEEISSIPEKFIGEWQQTSKDFGDGATAANFLVVTESQVRWYGPAGTTGETYTFKKIIKKNEDDLIIECKNKSTSKIYLNFDNGVLQFEKIVPIGIDDLKSNVSNGKYRRKDE